MTISLVSKPGITGSTTLSIPKDWDPKWFRWFVTNMLKGADVRNAIGTNGISLTGTIASPYATLSLTGGGVIPPPAAGTTLRINGPIGNTSFTGNSPFALTIGLPSASTTSYAGIDFSDTATPKARIGAVFSGAGSRLVLGTSNNYTTGITNSAVTVDQNGGVSLAGSSVGTTLTIKGFNNVNGQSIDLVAGVANGGVLVQGFDSTGTTRTGYLFFISGNGGGGGATETVLDVDGTTANDLLSLAAGGSRRVQITGQGAVSVNAPTAAVTTLTATGQGAATTVLQLNAGSATNTAAPLYIVNGASATGTPGLRIDHSATAGTGTATFTATNKPTATAGGPVAWLPINLDGNIRYIPVWA